MYLELTELDPFYGEYLVSLLVQIHYYHRRCVGLVERMEQILGNPPHILE